MTENEWGIDPTKINIFTDPLTRRFKGYATHGGGAFDVPFMSQIEGNLWMGGCRWDLILPSEIDNVVSLYPFEKYAESRPLVNFEQIKMYDSQDQNLDQVNEIAARVNKYCKVGPTLVHCQAGLNRSGVVTARALMLRGWSAKAAIERLRTVRSEVCLCNPAFEAWLYEQEAKDEKRRLFTFDAPGPTMAERHKAIEQAREYVRVVQKVLDRQRVTHDEPYRDRVLMEDVLPEEMPELMRATNAHFDNMSRGLLSE